MHIGLCAHLTGGFTEAVGTQLLRDLRQRKDCELRAWSSPLVHRTGQRLLFRLLLPPSLAPTGFTFSVVVSASPCLPCPGVSGSCFPFCSLSGREEMSSPQESSKCFSQKESTHHPGPYECKVGSLHSLESCGGFLLLSNTVSTHRGSRGPACTGLAGLSEPPLPLIHGVTRSGHTNHPSGKQARTHR